MEEKDLIYGENGLIYKAETVLLRRNRINEKSEQKARQKIESYKIQKDKQKIPKLEVLRPDQFVYDYRQKQRNYAYFKLRKGNKKEIQLSDNQTILVLRITGDKNISENQKRILRRLGLHKSHEAHLFQSNQSLKDQLKLVENFVVYGQVNRKTLKELISKRGNFKIDNKLQLISSNKIVEDVLGKLGVVCVEDIVGEMSSNSKFFDEIKSALAYDY